jgi:hypothetical protein
MLLAVLLALCALDVIKLHITQEYNNTTVAGGGRHLIGLMRSMSVLGPLLYTSPGAPISPPLTPTLPLLPIVYPVVYLPPSAQFPATR